MKQPMLLLLALACACTSSSPGADGEVCTKADDCSGGYCAGGFCSGTTCECDPLVERDCSTEPRVDEDCQSGWMCVSTIATVHVSGFCRLPCSKGCPSTWTCQSDGFCGYDAPEPTVTIESAPTEIEVGVAASFSASATSPNGAITTIAWEFGDGGTAEGPEVTHAYSGTGTYTYGATATDAAGSSADDHGSIRVCLPLGSECYPFDSRGACCTGKRCAEADDGETRCQD